MKKNKKIVAIDPKKWEMVVREVGLSFVCSECNTNSFISPENMIEVGTPICSDCDCEMDYVATYIRRK